MEQRTSAFARIFAAVALIAAVLVVIVIVSSAMNGSSSNGSRHNRKHQVEKETTTHHRTKAKTYTVQTGDTLTAIAHKTGVPVAELLALNPEVDPQILIAGETLKLK